jgi:hypothetical protein
MGTFGSTHCAMVDEDEVSSDPAITAKCYDHHETGESFAIVNIYARFLIIPTSDENENKKTKTKTGVQVPRCCQDPYQQEEDDVVVEENNNYKVVEYSFKLDCTVTCDNPEDYVDPDDLITYGDDDNTNNDDLIFDVTNQPTWSPTTFLPTVQSDDDDDDDDDDNVGYDDNDDGDDICAKDQDEICNNEQQTFTCNDVHLYICPSVENICMRQTEGIEDNKYFLLTDEQCDEMKTKKLGDPCIELPQYPRSIQNVGMLDDKACYNTASGTTGAEHGVLFVPSDLTDSDSPDVACSVCSFSFPNELTFPPTNAPVVIEPPTDLPTWSPTTFLPTLQSEDDDDDDDDDEDDEEEEEDDDDDE